MTARDLSAVAIRLASVTFLFGGVLQLLQLANMAVSLRQSDSSGGSGPFLLYLLNLAVLMALWAWTFAFARTIAGWMCGRSSETVVTPFITTEELTSLGFGLLGLFFLVGGLRELSRFIAVYWIERGHSRLIGQDPPPTDVPGVVAVCVQLCLGALILVGPRGLVRALHRARATGGEGSAPPDTPGET